MRTTLNFKCHVRCSSDNVDTREGRPVDSKTLIGCDLRAANKFHVSINFSDTCRHVATVRPTGGLSLSLSLSCDLQTGRPACREGREGGKKGGVISAQIY